MINRKHLLSLVEKCRYEQELDKQIELLYRINLMLPPFARLRIPSLITDDYVRRALDTIELMAVGHHYFDTAE